MNNKILNGFFVKNIDYEKNKQLIREFNQLRIELNDLLVFLSKSIKSEDFNELSKNFNNHVFGLYGYYLNLLESDDYKHIYNCIVILSKYSQDDSVILCDELMKYALYEN